MKTPALFCSIPALKAQCSCQMSSRPGDVRSVGIVCAPAPLRVPFCITATRGCSACTSAADPTNRAVVRHHVEIDRADRIGRAHQLVFVVPQQIAEIDRAELAEREQAAHRLAVLGSLVMSFGVKLAHVGSAGRRRAAAPSAPVPPRHDAQVEAGDRQGVPRLDDDVLRLSIELGVAAWNPGTCSRLFDRRPVIDEVPDRNPLRQFLQCRRRDRRDSACRSGSRSA